MINYSYYDLYSILLKDIINPVEMNFLARSTYATFVTLYSHSLKLKNP